METNKLGMMELLDKDEAEFCDEDIVACFDEGVLEFLDNNNKDDFDGDFIQANPLEYLLDKTLVGQCLVHHGLCRKLAGVRPIPTSAITIIIKPDDLP